MPLRFEPVLSLLLSRVHTACLSAFGWCILCIVSIFLVFLSIFFISSVLQLIIPKLYFNTGTASGPIAVILFLPFSSDFSIILNLVLYSCFSLSFICWCCMPSLSSIPRYLYVFPCSSSCISLFMSITKFCKWNYYYYYYYYYRIFALYYFIVLTPSKQKFHV